MVYFKHFLLLALCLFISLLLNAQNCDKYYNDGLGKQSVQSIASQNAAIVSFKKAMACYDSPSKKRLCQKQIEKCNITIKKLSEAPKKKLREEKSKSNIEQAKKEEVADLVQDEKPSEAVDEPTPISEPIKAYLDTDLVEVKFKKKGGVENVKVRCGLGFSWTVEGAPNWLDVTTNETTLRIDCSPNKTGEKRSVVLHIISEGNQRDITVIQFNKNKF